jgi:hypothetical protein
VPQSSAGAAAALQAVISGPPGARCGPTCLRSGTDDARPAEPVVGREVANPTTKLPRLLRWPKFGQRPGPGTKKPAHQLPLMPNKPENQSGVYWDCCANAIILRRGMGSICAVPVADVSAAKFCQSWSRTFSTLRPWSFPRARSTS